jgi:predicted transcriptional regulator of viral defense system
MLLELQLTFLLVALLGDTVAVKLVVDPTFTLALAGDTVTPVTETVVPVFTVTLSIVDVHKVPSLCDVTHKPT